MGGARTSNTNASTTPNRRQHTNLKLHRLNCENGLCMQATGKKKRGGGGGGLSIAHSIRSESINSYSWLAIGIYTKAQSKQYVLISKYTHHKFTYSFLCVCVWCVYLPFFPVALVNSTNQLAIVYKYYSRHSPAPSLTSPSQQIGNKNPWQTCACVVC